MLIKHPKIYLDAAGRTTDALLVQGGRIQAVGQEAKSQRTRGERVVEAEGACLFPALADAHCHLWGLGLRAGAMDVSAADSADALAAKLATYDLDQSPSGWVIGYGWDDHGWPDAQRPDRGLLDAIFPQAPVCLHRVDRHGVVVNTAAIDRAGIDEAGRPDLARSHPDGVAERDARGELTGLFVDAAMAPIIEAIPEVRVAEDRRVFEQSAARLVGHGITSAHMARTEVSRLAMLRDMAETGRLPVRVCAMVDGQDDDLAEVLEAGPVRDPRGWLSMATIKLFADGALGSGGAHLLDAYKEGGHGLAMYEPDALADEVAARMEDGWQVAVHAIGDAAARDVLDAFAGVDGARRRQLRPRLEHAQMLADRDCRRLGELSTIASIQPIHLRSDATWADQVLSDEQLDRLYPWPALAEHATLAAGSDYPIADCNPWHGIATAVTRRVETDADQGGHGRPFFGHKALTRRQILAAYTCGAATAAGWESTLGRLDKGFVADVIALEHDPFEASADQLWGMDVLQVWMGGRAML